MWGFILQLLIIIPFLISVAFITLFERKILSYSQLRQGPNKVSMIGFLQPIADAVKLFVKELVYVKDSNYYMFMMAPSVGMAITLVLLGILPSGVVGGVVSVGVAALVIMSMGVYPIFLEGWSSFSQYSFLGALRSMAQTISYEISLALLFFSMYLFNYKFSLSLGSELGSVSLFLMSPLLILLIVSAVAETNRTPFDFAEGESELVSGFNTEYGGGSFALIFMAEYGMIIFFSVFLGVLICQGLLFSFSSVLFSLGLMFFWVWLRSTFPRFRYDKLLNIAWKSILPWAIIFLSYFGMIYLF